MNTVIDINDISVNDIEYLTNNYVRIMIKSYEHYDLYGYYKYYQGKLYLMYVECDNRNLHEKEEKIENLKHL